MRIRPRKVYSQGDQDGIVESVFAAIRPETRTCVEFGFDATTLTGGSGSNTARLIIEEGWKPILIDVDNENPEIGLHKRLLTPENLPETFEAFGVLRDVDYVSIDVDSNDLWLFRSMLVAGYRPRLVSVEYNSGFSLYESMTMPPDCGPWRGDACHGASLLALRRVAGEYGYQLVAVERTLDAFFVREDLLRPGAVPALESFRSMTSIQCHPSPSIERGRIFQRYP